MLNELIQQECYDNGIDIKSMRFVDDCLDAVLVGRTIYHSDKLYGYDLNDVLIHEEAHAETCPVNLFKADKVTQKKFERIANDRTMERLFSLDTIIELYEYGAQSFEDYAEALEISVRFICECISRYKSQYGCYVDHDGYRINFEPFFVHNIEEI